MWFKSRVKRVLGLVGLWNFANFLRQLPSIWQWLGAGCSGPAPHAVKMMTVKAYVSRYGMQEFVETGTYLGDTLAYVASTGIQCTSIELSSQLHQAACRRFQDFKNVRLIEGDSGIKLLEVLTGLRRPALFWLDGHYSVGVTAQADIHTPISAELQAILRHPVKGHVILIDDARCFDGTNDYPHLDDLLRVVREDGGYVPEVSIDIIRLIPKTALGGQ